MKKILLVLCALLFSALPSVAQFADQGQYVATTGGTNNAQTAAIANVGSPPPVGVPFRVKAGVTNTNAMTLNINGGGAINVYKPSAGGPTPLTGGEIVSGQIFTVVYDGSVFQIQSVLNAAAASVTPSPQGYLTPCKLTSPVSGCTAGFWVPTGDVTAATVLYYEPLTGNQIPIWNGSQFVVFNFTEAQMTLTLGSGNLANTIYDVCVWSNGGTPAIGTGPAWTTSTAGSGARGSGAGTSQIQRTNGSLWTNAVSWTVTNGGSSNAVGAGLCTVVGSILMDGTNGQVSFTRTVGQSRRWAASNIYNPQEIVLQVADPTASWTYNSATIRPSNNAATNSATFLYSVTGDIPDIQASQNVTLGAGSPGTYDITNGVGWNSTTAYSGRNGISSVSSSSAVATKTSVIGQYQPAPFLGAAVATSLEANPTPACGSCTFVGTSAGMLFSARFKG